MDLVMLEGQILTMNDQSSRAEALAVKNGKFVAVGSNSEIRNHITESTKVVHLNGRTITPGFIQKFFSVFKTENIRASLH